MYSSFYIKENRLDELKKFIRTKTHSVRFKHNPLKEGDKFFISLTMDVEDGNILNELFNKWYDIDNPPNPPKTNILDKIKNLFKKY